jgi:hypothetical protein
LSAEEEVKEEVNLNFVEKRKKEKEHFFRQYALNRVERFMLKTRNRSP